MYTTLAYKHFEEIDSIKPNLYRGEKLRKRPRTSSSLVYFLRRKTFSDP